MSKDKCHDCGVEPGEQHLNCCDVERCPFCGGQLLSCECHYHELAKEFELPPIEEFEPTDEQWDRWSEILEAEGRIVWTGVWPGVAECEEYGLWCRWEDGKWVRCDADAPRATHALNDLYEVCEWNRELKKFVLLEEN